MKKEDGPIRVNIKDGHATVSTLDIGEKFKKDHKNVLQAVDNLLGKIPEEFARLNFQPSNYLDEKGKLQRMFEVTRDGFVLLVMGFTGDEAIDWKIKYINAFNKMEEALLKAQHRDSEPLLAWGQARLSGKMSRRNLTDAINDDLIPLAKRQGSNNSGKLFLVYSKLFNRLFVRLEGFKIPKGVALRDCFSVSDLGFQSKTEEAMAGIIKSAVEQDMNYKNIYQHVKAIMEPISKHYVPIEPALPPRNPVPLLSEFRQKALLENK